MPPAAGCPDALGLAAASSAAAPVTCAAAKEVPERRARVVLVRPDWARVLSESQVLRVPR